mgnify:FL=1
MTVLRYFLLLGSLMNLFVCCAPYHGIYYDGHYKTETRSKKYSQLFSPLRISGKSTTVDTLNQRIVSKRRFRTGVRFLTARPLLYEETVFFDTTGRKVMCVTVENGKRDTTEFFARARN